MCVCVCVCVCVWSKVKWVSQSCPTHFKPMDYSPLQVPLSVGILQASILDWVPYWNGLLYTSPGDLPNPGIKPWSPTLQTLYHLSHQGSPRGPDIKYWKGKELKESGNKGFVFPLVDSCGVAPRNSLKTSLLLFRHYVLSNSLPPRGLQHARLISPSLSAGVYSDSCPLSQWCYLTILSSAAPFYCLQSFLVLGSFPKNRLFASGGQSIVASASVLSMNIPGWFPSGLTGLISLLFKRLSRIFFSSTTVQKHRFFGAVFYMVQLSHSYMIFMVQLSHLNMTTGKTIALTIWTLLVNWYLCFWIHCLGLS